ncbi:MAG TPA: UDP-N-acetylenolpyruvoylglucosamine reductase, partial [Dongiaceae bacterium]|nr:UDP-N-acetylenolpyruvoylglucosamine reductase [Dongiaceae bacterium]
GSIFKNPPGDYAGRLIEACGLKGRRVGGAEVSPAHANWLVNTGGATAAEIEALGETVRRRVRETSGIELRWEIRRIGIEAHAIDAPIPETRR